MQPRVIVAQIDARRRYAVPLIIHRAGYLEYLYTGTSSRSLLGRVLCFPQRKIRVVPNELEKEKVASTDRPALVDILFPFGNQGLDRYLKKNEVFGEFMIRKGLANASGIYSFNIGCRNFLSYVKCRGVKVISDIFMNPLTYHIYSQLYSEDQPEYEKCIRLQAEYSALYTETFKLSDVILCPSNWVADGVGELCPNYAHKIKICPYGTSIDYNGRANKPVRGRILWAGRDWLGKGLHYLAQAANELKARYPEMDFRAAGVTYPEVLNMPQFRNINFLGKMNKQEMQEEFLTADMFVFPTLSEGIAGVVIEAIAAGCPVITTRCAGIDAITNGKSGIVNPPRDPSALVEAIEKVYCDREFRNTLAANTRILAGNYTLDAWKNRLVSILKAL